MAPHPPSVGEIAAQPVRRRIVLASIDPSQDGPGRHTLRLWRGNGAKERLRLNTHKRHHGDGKGDCHHFHGGRTPWRRPHQEYTRIIPYSLRYSQDGREHEMKSPPTHPSAIPPSASLQHRYITRRQNPPPYLASSTPPISAAQSNALRQ